MRNLGLLVLVAVTASGCSAGTLSPASPTPVASETTASVSAGAPQPLEESYISDSCGFPVLVELNGKVKELPLPGGRTKVLFPAFTGRVTNIATQAQVTLLTTGSFHITELPTGGVELVYTGRNSYDDPFEGRLLLLIGRFSESFDADFNTISPLSGDGQVQDICQMIN